MAGKRNKQEWYIEGTSDIIPFQEKEVYIIRHRGCYVVGDKNRNWGTVHSTFCQGCDKKIPSYLTFQRDLLNG